jgi:hypothetical protein
VNSILIHDFLLYIIDQMLSRFFGLSKNVFKPQNSVPQAQNTTSSSAIEPTVDTQLSDGKEEENSMVTTRRQSHSRTDGEMPPDVSSGVVESGRRKRKLDGGSKSPSEGKKRKVEIEASTHGVGGEVVGNGEVIPMAGVKDDVMAQADAVEKSPSGYSENVKSERSDNRDTPNVALDGEGLSEKAQVESKSEKKRQGKKEKSEDQDDPTPPTNGHTDLKSLKRQHIRFGSEEPEDVVMNDSAEPPKSLQPILPTAEDEDEDEAPETVENMEELKKVQVQSMKAAQAQER